MVLYASYFRFECVFIVCLKVFQTKTVKTATKGEGVYKWSWEKRHDIIPP